MIITPTIKPRITLIGNIILSGALASEVPLNTKGVIIQKNRLIIAHDQQIAVNKFIPNFKNTIKGAIIRTISKI